MMVPGPVEFWMGSPEIEAGASSYELLHRRRIGRNFAIATKSVTVRQFRQFLEAHSVVNASFFYTQQFAVPERPVVGITWYQAAGYCRWLSEQEGIPEEQMCYPPIADIMRAQDERKPLPLPADCLRRRGYRLPTEAEWEYACRAQTRTSRSFGSPEELLPQYAWYSANAQNRPWPVGQKKPNDFGLFDMYGNVSTWCQDPMFYWGTTTIAQPIEEMATKLYVTDPQWRATRGSGYDALPLHVRSASRAESWPLGRGASVGLRPVKTYP